jgi:hypothetical protein
MDISLTLCLLAIVVLLAILTYLFKHRDIGPSNEEYYNEDGDHYYYDRKLIRYKQQHKSNKDK